MRPKDLTNYEQLTINEVGNSINIFILGECETNIWYYKKLVETFKIIFDVDCAVIEYFKDMHLGDKSPKEKKSKWLKKSKSREIAEQFHLDLKGEIEIIKRLLLDKQI